MHHILSAFGGPGRTVLSFAPTYSMYPIYARDTFTRYVTVPRAPDHSIDVGCRRCVAPHPPDRGRRRVARTTPPARVLSLADIRALHAAGRRLGRARRRRGLRRVQCASRRP